MTVKFWLFSAFKIPTARDVDSLAGANWLWCVAGNQQELVTVIWGMLTLTWSRDVAVVRTADVHLQIHDYIMNYSSKWSWPLWKEDSLLHRTALSSGVFLMSSVPDRPSKRTIVKLISCPRVTVLANTEFSEHFVNPRSPINFRVCFVPEEASKVHTLCAQIA